MLRLVIRSKQSFCFPFQVYPDRACKRTVLSLTVKCHNSGNECDWTGELINLPVSKQRFFISTLSDLFYHTLWGKSSETSPDLNSLA